MLSKHSFSGKKYGEYLIVKHYMLTAEDIEHIQKVLKKKKVHSLISPLRDNHCYAHHI